MIPPIPFRVSVIAPGAFALHVWPNSMVDYIVARTAGAGGTMSRTMRLILAVCVLTAVVLVTGCGQKKPATSTVSKQTQTAPKATEAAPKPDKQQQAPAAAAPSPGLLDGGLGSALSGNPAPSSLSLQPAPKGAPAPTVVPSSGRPTAGQLILVLQAAYRQMASLRSEGTFTTFTKADGKNVAPPQTMRTLLLFQRPDKLVLSNAAARLVINGDVVYNYAPASKRYVKDKTTNQLLKQLVLARPGVGPLGLLLGLDYRQPIVSSRMLPDTKLSGREVFVLSLRLRSGMAIPPGVEAVQTLWVGKNDLGLYKSVVVLSTRPKPVKGSGAKLPKLVETTLITTVSRFEPNAKLSASLFTFKPPAGAKPYEQPKQIDLSNKPAPDFSFQWTDGTTKKLSDFRGKVVILDFWALPMCQRQLPILQSLTDKLKDVQVITVNLNKNKPKVEDLLKKNSLTFPIVYADEAITKVAVEGYGLMGLPTMFIIDENGVVRAAMMGQAPQKDIEEKLSKIRQP